MPLPSLGVAQHSLTQRHSSLRPGSPRAITLNGKLITTPPKAYSFLGWDCPSKTTNESRGGPSHCCSHGNHSSRLTGQEELFAGVPYLPFCGGPIPTRNNGSSVKKSAPTHHKDPIISWHDGFQKKGETQNAAQGILARGGLSSGNPCSSGVQDILLCCNESPLVQRPPTICL